VFEISAVTGEGTRTLLQALMQRIEEKRAGERDEQVDEDEPWDPLQ
jgi:predicted GTPase